MIVGKLAAGVEAWVSVDAGSARNRAACVIFEAGMLSTDEALLDNAAYSALCSAHARFAQVRGRARRYPVDVAPFLAVPSQPTAKDWRDAAGLVVPGTYAAILHSGTEVPPGWTTIRAFDVMQMIGERVTGLDCAQAISLGDADVPEMLELVAQTAPGPFLNRTIELGDYLGIRRGGALVAMAGERLRFAGWTEISGVCTMPTDRGHGLASRLVGALIAGIQLRSQRAFLHVLSTNTSAVRLYEELGFRARRSATITVMTPEPAENTRD
ncbi:MAG: GNAT family N-acetyltransferase [Solirubrobacteraceae bacterium]